MIRLVLLAAVAIIASTPAFAQYGLRASYQNRFGIFSSASFNPFLPSLPQVPGRFSIQTYTLGGNGASGPFSIQYTYYRNTAVVAAYSAPSVYGGGYYGGLSSGHSSLAEAPNATQTAMRKAIGAAQRNAQWDKSLGSDLKEFEKALVPAPREEKPALAVKLNEALIDPTEEAILGGDVLNELIELIQALEAKGKKATSGLCAPDLISRIAFDGDVAADAANLFRKTELPAIPCLKERSNRATLEALEATFEPVALAVIAGKKPNPAEVDKFVGEISKSRKSFETFVKEARADEACQLTEYLNGLEAAAKYVKEPSAMGIAGTKWSTLGVAVSDLTKHMAKFKLRIGEASKGDESAYFSLHRGLLAYYAGLLQAK